MWSTTFDPDNRLVSRSLEKDWNAKLVEVEQLEREYADLPTTQRQPLSTDERDKILALAQDLPALWQAPTTTQTERKQLLRLLIKDVALSKQGRVIHIAIRWQTNACTSLEITRPLPSPVAKRTSPEVIERIRALAPTQTEAQIAAQLNAEGFKPGASATFTASKVKIGSGSPIASPTAVRKHPAPAPRANAVMAATVPKPLPSYSTSTFPPSPIGVPRDASTRSKAHRTGPAGFY